MLIAQTSVGQGGLGLIYPSHCAVPDFVLTIVSSARYAGEEGFKLNPDTGPVVMHQTIHDLYQRSQNPKSRLLKLFQDLLHVVADAAVSDNCPKIDHSTQLLTQISVHSARGRPKKASSTYIRRLLGATM